jgi:hypothetical protein
MKIWILTFVCLFFGQVASANTVDVKFDSVRNANIVQIWGGGHEGESVYAGIYDLTVDEIKTIGTCIDLEQWATYNLSKYDVTSLALAPVSGGMLGGPMGKQKADYVNEIYSRFYNPRWENSSDNIDRDEVTAFQCAIWEIVYEDTPKVPEMYDVSSDGTDGKLGFSCKGADEAIANKWLHSLGNESPFCRHRIVALSSGNFQDYAVQTIPEPTTVLILSVGCIFSLFRRYSYGK